MIYDIIVVGAGASGLMCGAFLQKRALFIEKNTQLAKKIAISGGGKCNITNRFVSTSNYVGDTDFIESVFQRFSKEDLLTFLEKNHLPMRLKDDRFYFCKDSSKQIIKLLEAKNKKHHFRFGCELQSIRKDKELFVLETNQGAFFSKNVVIATGGASYATIGATDIALKVAQSFGIDYKPFKPALVGLTLQKEQFWMKALSGISVDVSIDVGEKRVEGSLLFAHKGISGPAVLNASLYWQKGAICIDFLPKHSLRKLLKKANAKFISSALPLPKRFIKAFLEHIGMQDKACNTVTQEELMKLAKLRNYSFAPAGNFGFSKAEVSLGGIMTKELTNILESKKVPNLYFIGEAVDVTGQLGGYNFQWAFSSGVVVAKALNQIAKKSM